MTMPREQLVSRRVVVLSRGRKCAARRFGQLHDMSGEMTVSRRLPSEGPRLAPPVDTVVAGADRR